MGHSVMKPNQKREGETQLFGKTYYIAALSSKGKVCFIANFPGGGATNGKSCYTTTSSNCMLPCCRLKQVLASAKHIQISAGIMFIFI